jgi:excisionase family DNA binding protein
VRTVVKPEERLLTPKEAADMFRVCTKTVDRWAAAGHLTKIRTPGGRVRYLEAEVLELRRRR